MGKGVSMRPAGRAARLAATVLLATCALMLVCARAALAAPPVLSIVDPVAASSTDEQQPRFQVTSTDSSDQVTLALYAGDGATGTPIQTTIALMPLEPWFEGAVWELTPDSPLAPGQYTAVAEQANMLSEAGASPPVSFTIDTPPVVSMNPIASPTEDTRPTLSGSAADGIGDLKVLVTIYEGGSRGGTVVATEEVSPGGPDWEYKPSQPLAEGSYTAVATERDEAGTVAESEAVTFIVLGRTLTLETSAFERTGRTGLVSGPRPSFQGSASVEGNTVIVRVYRGPTAAGSPEREIEVVRTGTRWATGPVEALESGAYTVVAEQGEAAEGLELIVDATPPHVTLTFPANGSSTSNTSEAVAGSAGVEEGDIGKVAIHLYRGSGATEVPLQTISAEAVGQSWDATIAGLEPGTYTALAEQEDDVGNIGYSEAATFTVVAPPVTPTPSALVSETIPVSATTIPVSATTIPLMQPFPVVRVAGSFSSAGAKIGVLTVLAPVGATVRVTCKGGGCPPRGQRVRAVAGARSKGSSVLIAFHRFERSLRTGAVLDVWIADAGEIGKFTRLVIRRDKPPSRTDLCLNPAGTAPLTCPAS